ncbi:hypothetical protein SAMN04487846_1673 [Microbacterium sp. cf046]|uniref:ClbS/DfsB family four-helix bundle protein n=1 Tax=Microbacterium sp. cf046 TaxID=1761803 RepID=UPI0008E21044|nr:ClbS/DfsB family four-helix bundle protein [Microbacterium sp. cf046]SFS03450.1 hypothetical protein SAMN04487846_1673 [Microbacterium sp. cf046]
MTFTHAGLLERNDAEFTALIALIDSLAADRLAEDFAGSGRDRNVRDVIAHLHAWHILLERWYSEGQSGGSPRIPAEGYSWARLDDLNEELRQQWQDTTLAELLPLLKASHESLQAMVALHTDAELDDPGAYAWTRGTALGEFALECGGNHYAWGRDTIATGLGL